MPELIVWLDAPASPDSPDHEATPEAVGTKAHSLIRLAAAGLPVPYGFAVLAEAFSSDLVPDSDSDGVPGAASGSGSHPDTETVPDAVEDTVSASFQRAGASVLSPAAGAAIREAYAALGRRLGEPEPLVAVRSSGTAEDLSAASFAGVYETTLGVRGGEQVLESAARCWRSLWSARAVAYRAEAERRIGRRLPAPRMAVLVQALLPAGAWDGRWWMGSWSQTCGASIVRRCASSRRRRATSRCAAALRLARRWSRCLMPCSANRV